MQTRPLGRTGQNSSIIIFGGFALSNVNQKEADAGIEMALAAGINHVDVSPIYGQAETRLGSYFKRQGCPFFLGCKTAERTQAGAWDGLQRSLETLKVDHLDLYQFHMVDSERDLDIIFGPGGALEAFQEAKRQGLLRFIGITGHHPPLHDKALHRFDFDTVMFPLNRVHAAHFEGWNDCRPLLKTAQEKDTGVLAIKTAAKRLWAESAAPTHKYGTWYEPFDQAAELEKCFQFTLSQPITGAVLPGELKLWPAIFDAVARFKPLTVKQQQAFVSESAGYPPLHAPWMDE